MNNHYGSMYYSFDCMPNPPSEHGVLKTNSSMSVDQTLPLGLGLATQDYGQEP